MNTVVTVKAEARKGVSNSEAGLELSNQGFKCVIC